MPSVRPRQIFGVAVALWFGVAGSMTAARAAPPRHGPRDLSDGIIKRVTCRGRSLHMALQTPHQLLQLSTDNYFRVDFTATNFKPKGTLNPCKEMVGMKAQAIFYDVPHHPNEGVLISVQLTKPKPAHSN